MDASDRASRRRIITLPDRNRAKPMLRPDLQPSHEYGSQVRYLVDQVEG